MRPSIETRILSQFTSGAEAEAYTISDLARRTKAAYPHVHAAVTTLLTEGVLNAATAGHALFCTLNLENDLCRTLLNEANYHHKQHLLAAPNLKNLDAEVRRLVIAEPRILAVISGDNGLRFIITDKDTRRPILQQTTLLNISFTTPNELQQELLASMTLLKGSTVLFGYDRLLLLLQPIHEQLRLNHSTLFRGATKGERR